MLRRFAVLAAVPMAIVVSSCSIGTPKPATYVTDVSATLNGVVSSNEEPAEVTYWFNYGTSTDYGTVTPDRTYQIPADSQDDTKYPVSEPISGLEPNTTYHYQVCTSPGIEPGSRGCTNQDQTFTTGAVGSGESGIAFTSARSGGFKIWTMDDDGSNATAIDRPEELIAAFTPAWSPGGERIAFSARATGDCCSNADIWVMDAVGSNPTRLTDRDATPGDDVRPVWSPDGSRIAFDSMRDGNSEIYVMDADGSDQVNLTTSPASDDAHPAWSPDGSKIAWTSNRGFTGYDVYVMDSDGSGVEGITDDPAADYTPTWSPDGQEIAFGSSRNGTVNIFAMEADGDNPVPVTTGGSNKREPTWSADGARIAYQSEDEVFVVDTSGGTPINITDNGAFDGEPAWSPRP